MNNLLLFFTMTLASLAHSQISCIKTATPKISLAQALEKKMLDVDATEESVAFSVNDAVNVITRFSAPLRPEFDLVILPGEAQTTTLALIPKNANQDLIGQQVVQWDVINTPAQEIAGIQDQQKDGSVTLLDRLGRKIKTKIVVARDLNVETTSYKTLVDYVKNNPLEVDPSKSSSRLSRLTRFLFGKVWVKIFGPGVRIKALDSSEKLLQTEKVIVPGKEKFLHVVGEVFTSEMTVDASSPYSGHLAPGTYHVVGRLSSSMKNLDLKNEKNQFEPNSLAISLLIFKTKDQLEVPGLLFVQDSLTPIVNSGLTGYRLSNNPAFAFKPKSIREFFEQGFSIFGVALASFKNKRDSGRGLQGNYRSTFGAAANSVNVFAGDQVVASRFVSLKLVGQKTMQNAQTHIDVAGRDGNTQFILSTSKDSKDWNTIGSLTQITWLGVDSHELTFPHGLSGGIDPHTLKAAASSLATSGLLIPTEVKSNSP